MTKPLDFQSIIMTLQHYWAKQGCIIRQPYHTEVGAGTMNPATALRVLGPEPWNVAYVEPSIRPDDGRYGENPNRLNQHHQFQVILKPDPGNPQEIYLNSLTALGIDPRQHDIRFVEDNWESPALGAWGLGWEVWLDGLEITQFTYFQQAGGLPLEPVSVELTYGLERIAMALQGVRDFRDIRWNERFTYGDIFLQSEQEFSKYSFELADVERLRQLYTLYVTEAETCLAENLVLPAHDYVLKCSQVFNLLDTRGAIGVTERADFFRRMRGLSRRVAQAYIGKREKLGYPWLKTKTAETDTGSPVTFQQPDKPLSAEAPLLVEIGTEELPAKDLENALVQLQNRVPAMLENLRLTHGKISILGTPRRLVIHVEALAPRQPNLEKIVKGPPANRAFDANGNPTKAAEGFARSKGISAAELKTRKIDGGEYVVALIQEDGKPSVEVLAKALPELIKRLQFSKTMRWEQSGTYFSRPIRWLLAIHGEHTIPFEFAGLHSGNYTRGLRFYQPENFEIHRPGDYFSAMQSQGIQLDPEQRRQSIEEQIQALAHEVNGEIAADPSLLSEVTNLVEAPTALRGEFEAEYLELPRYVLTSVMKKHQRYFPIEKDGKLLPYFITIRNGDDKHLELVRQGNADVIRARFADAAYFVREDVKKPLESYVAKLDKLTFHTKLGSMLDKTKRLEKLVTVLGTQLNLTAEENQTAVRAAHLCKADLATQMVIEMTSLQGLMGRDYALKSGEPEAVATAIFEHYLPRSANDIFPQTLPGLALGAADRLDSLVGLFAAGAVPTGNKDPFAQRRSAMGLVLNLIHWNLDFDLRKAIDMTAAYLPVEATEETRATCLNFITERLRNILLEQGNKHDVIDAVLAVQGHNPARAAAAVKSLGQWVVRQDWEKILPEYARCVRITRSLDREYLLEKSLFQDKAEKELYQALVTAAKTQRAEGSVDDFLQAFLPMIPAIRNFFDKVLVMTDDQKTRENRLALLQRIVSLADGVADLSRLEGF